MQSPFVKTSLPASVRLEKGEGGLPRLRVENAQAAGEVYPHGAHITAWQPKGQSPVIWVSRESAWAPDKPIRGGVPICFPWFAAHATEKAAPSHGYARLADWTLVAARDEDGGATSLAFELSQPTTPWPLWPHPFAATFRVLFGTKLSMSFEVRNTGRDPFTFEEALHTYFAVQFVKEISLTGLEDTEYLDKVNGMQRKREGKAPIRFAGETDRIYLDTTAACTIRDPGRRRHIAVSKGGSKATVVWNPWTDRAKALPDFGDLEWPEMVCVESGNVNVHAVTLAPGAQHVLQATLEVAAQ